MSYAAIGLREQRYRAKEESLVTCCRLSLVPIHQPSRELDKGDGRPLGHKQVAHVGVQPRDKYLRREASGKHLVEGDKSLDIIPCTQHIRNREVGVIIKDIERRGHILIVERRAAERHRLIEHRQRIAHTAIGLMSNEVESLVVGLNTLLRGDVAQILNAIFHLYAVEVVYLATRQDGGYNLMLLGRRKDEYSVTRWLLQRFEKGVEGGRREHMHLVDNEYRVAALLRDDTHLLDEVTNIIYRVVRRSVELMHIQRASLVERAARLALVTRLATLRIEAVDSLGKYSCAGGLTHAARATEEVGVSQLATLDSVLQGRGDMSLPDNRSEGCGAILAC